MKSGGEKLRWREALRNGSYTSFRLLKFVALGCVMSVMSLNLIYNIYKRGSICR
jgi:hypothetical protein